MQLYENEVLNRAPYSKMQCPNTFVAYHLHIIVSTILFAYTDSA
jgi:hypothetical protein